MKCWSTTLALCIAAACACAAPERSERPVPRPDAPGAISSAAGVVSSIRPEFRRKPSGGVCEDPRIVGVAIPEIEGRLASCGVANPIRVQSVAGVVLDRPARMDCPTARALADWVETGVRRTLPRVRSMKVAAGYACRTRNNQPGAKVSEHGRGRAIDISAFRLANGREITVLEGWADRRQGRALRQIHGAACGPFGTVLGPDADRFHQDHFHLDTAQYRSGSYCR